MKVAVLVCSTCLAAEASKRETSLLLLGALLLCGSLLLRSALLRLLGHACLLLEVLASAFRPSLRREIHSSPPHHGREYMGEACHTSRDDQRFGHLFLNCSGPPV